MKNPNFRFDHVNRYAQSENARHFGTSELSSLDVMRVQGQKLCSLFSNYELTHDVTQE